MSADDAVRLINDMLGSMEQVRAKLLQLEGAAEGLAMDNLADARLAALKLSAEAISAARETTCLYVLLDRRVTASASTAGHSHAQPRPAKSFEYLYLKPQS